MFSVKLCSSCFCVCGLPRSSGLTRFSSTLTVWLASTEWPYLFAVDIHVCVVAYLVRVAPCVFRVHLCCQSQWMTLTSCVVACLVRVAFRMFPFYPFTLVRDCRFLEPGVTRIRVACSKLIRCSTVHLLKCTSYLALQRLLLLVPLAVAVRLRHFLKLSRGPSGFYFKYLPAVLK